MTKQEEEWAGEFGREYTDRNPIAADDVNNLWLNNFGVTRTSINEEFIGWMDKNIRILEVGTNTGSQLDVLRKMGFNNLWGIEINEYALNIARKNVSTANLVRGSAEDIPFKDGFFDLVFTSGVLIHIPDDALRNVLKEIHRVSKRYIYGYEYFSKSRTRVLYRGKDGLLWKDDFANLFLKQFSDLKLIKSKKLVYKNNPSLIDEVYLLEKI